MQCRIAVDGQIVTDKNTRVGAQGGSLACVTVVP